jgi:hypothetical protein
MLIFYILKKINFREDKTLSVTWSEGPRGLIRRGSHIFKTIGSEMLVRVLALCAGSLYRQEDY